MFTQNAGDLSLKFNIIIVYYSIKTFYKLEVINLQGATHHVPHHTWNRDKGKPYMYIIKKKKLI